MLGFDLLDKDNKVLATAKGPGTKPAKGWAFTAVEADAPAGTAGLRVWFSTTGEAYLDDVVTAAMVVEQLFNPTFDPNSKGGVTFWDDALTDGLEGTPRGKLSCDPIGGRNGSSALLVSVPRVGLPPATSSQPFRCLMTDSWSSSSPATVKLRRVRRHCSSAGWIDKHG